MKATRLLLTMLALSIAAAGLTAQQQPPAAKAKNDTDGQPKDAIARVAKDLQAAEERLKNTDPGDMTRKIQRDVIDGLDELINQNTKSPSEGGGGAANKTQTGGSQKQNAGTKSGNPNNDARQDKQTGRNENSGQQDQTAPAKAGKDGDAQSKNKDQGKGEEDKIASGKQGGKKDGGKDDQKSQAKGNESNKEKDQQGGLASAKNDKMPKNKSNLAAELYRTDWGHLPLTKRLEMDAYSRERFMPRYDEILQQYYRSVVEQGQKKDH